MLKGYGRIANSLLLVLLIASLIAGCAGGGGNPQNSSLTTTAASGGAAASDTAAVEQAQPPLEYTYVTEIDPSKFASAEHDVVTPYVEKKFNIKVKDVIYYNAQIQPFKEMMNQWIAANNLPDVFLTSSVEYSSTADLGVFADLESYIKNDMPNLNKYLDQKYLNAFRNNGVLDQIPCVELNETDPKYASDPYISGNLNHAMWVREDILKKAGYTFETTAEIAKRTTEAGKKPTLDDFKINPPINTSEDFYNMLKKIQALNLKVGDKPVIPFEMYNWYMYHEGTMFDFGAFSIDSTGNVSGYLGAPGAKPWFKFLNRLYNEKLIDQDFALQKADQTEAKIASGRVACGAYVDKFNEIQASMKKIVPDATIRYIPWPKDVPGHGYFDIFKGGFRSVAINKNFKDIKRLIKYFDWFYSDEGLDTITWGPEEAGLWEMKDGKKVFKDKTVEADMLSGKKLGKGADYYGLYDWSQVTPAYYSKAANGIPFFTFGNPRSYLRSYPLKLDIETLSRDICTQAGFNFTGTASYPVGNAASATDTYFWGDFMNQDSAKLWAAKSDDEFNKAWDEVYKIFLDKGQYEQAVKDMTKVLKP